MSLARGDQAGEPGWDKGDGTVSSGFYFGGVCSRSLSSLCGWEEEKIIVLVA